MKNYSYQNSLIGKKQLKQLLGWSFKNYDSMQACSLADELKFLGFNYASKAGISISIEDLRVPFFKNLMLTVSNQEITDSEKIFCKGKINEVEKYQKLIDTWGLTSESLKEQVVNFFKKYDPLNSVYVMAFSGARGNLSQVRQLVGMRGLMSDPSGEILNLPIKKNFREGLTVTDYLMSGYGARKGIIDTALKTANSGYLTRRLIDVAQDIIIREKDCSTDQSFRISISNISTDIIGRILNKSVFNLTNNDLLATKNTQVTPKFLKKIKEEFISNIFIRSPLTCKLYRSVCQQCYGWDLSTENLVDMGAAIGILAGQSIGEPGTQLTMRTFHTGGVFNSEIRNKIISPGSGLLYFSKFLKTNSIRTNRGEDVLITINAGILILISDNDTSKIIKIQIGQNTILFPKNNQYVHKDMVIGELINNNRQVRREIKPILANNSGEVFIPKIKNKSNRVNESKLIWLLSGQLYNSPINSFVNFHSDYKINAYSYIFRTKIINNYPGFIKYNNNKNELYQSRVLITSDSLKLSFLNFYRLSSFINNFNYILKFANDHYLLYSKQINSRIYLIRNLQNKFATLLTNNYKTQTGGTIYYNFKIRHDFSSPWEIIYFYFHEIEYLKKRFKSNKKQLEILHRTILWESEETHTINYEKNVLLVKNNEYISKNFEFLPDYFSKIAGLVKVKQENNLVQQIQIKNGVLYEIEKPDNIDYDKKVFYPGELIQSIVFIMEPCICEHICHDNKDYLLIRPFFLYEFSRKRYLKQKFQSSNLIDKKLILNYEPKQSIKTSESINIISEILKLQIPKVFNHYQIIELINYQTHNLTLCRFIKVVNFNDFIFPSLKYKNILSCLLTQKYQFIDRYTNISYLESLTSNCLEIIKIKINLQDIKQILLLTNDDCTIVQKEFINKHNQAIKNFIINSKNTNQIGKIILENKYYFTIQKGRPYFFPNCPIDRSSINQDLEYKFLPINQIKFHIKTKRKIHANTKNIFNISRLTQKNLSYYTQLKKFPFKFEFSKLFIKNNGYLYSCLIPRFLITFKLNSLKKKITNPLLQFKFIQNESFFERTLLFQTIDTSSKKKTKTLKPGFTFIKFLEFPFQRSAKSVGLYSINEDIFDFERNSVFCARNQFIEEGTTLGLLNLEKEITGDIVQGLPRIEEILEARRKKQLIKRLPLSKKQNILIQKTSIDPEFLFRKVGTSLKETDKINPHKLLKAYFNYYGLRKPFSCDQEKFVMFNRLLDNFEGCYKSFKKVQSFILNSVQGIYKSQGVSINDKHLEIIIKQMTTKVVISYEGSSPILKHEIIDLYHIETINQTLLKNKKKCAYYFPILLGITKASLNNPSFISAASFQETTRILTKAAIEGRIDWLRGLKENIIIGHLIPAGTGKVTYKNAFKKLKSSL